MKIGPGGEEGNGHSMNTFVKARSEQLGAALAFWKRTRERLGSWWVLRMRQSLRDDEANVPNTEMDH